MEGLDFYEMGGIADELHQSLLELGSGCTRESEHQELFVLYIFQQQERGKLMYEYTCLAAARTGSDYDAADSWSSMISFCRLESIPKSFLYFEGVTLRSISVSRLPLKYFEMKRW